MCPRGTMLEFARIRRSLPLAACMTVSLVWAAEMRPPLGGMAGPGGQKGEISAALPALNPLDYCISH